MPLYEYECTACHKRTEKIQKFSDPEITVCPKCGGGLERVITAPAIAFKGGGWFADGYGNAKPAASGAGEGGKPESAGTETKPASGDAGTPAPAAAPGASAPATAAPAAAPSTAASTASKA